MNVSMDIPLLIIKKQSKLIIKKEIRNIFILDFRLILLVKRIIL